MYQLRQSLQITKYKLKNLVIKYQVLLAVTFILSLFFALRIPGLGSDISHTDSARWHSRSHEFIKALQTKDLLSTYQHNQPGVVLMWLGAGYEYVFHKDAIDSLNLDDSDIYLTIHRESETILVLSLSLLLLVQLLLIHKLFNFKVVFFYSLFTATEPYLIGVDRIFHVTSLETYLLFTSFLFIYLWFKEGNKLHLTFSAILFSLSLLTKTTSLVLLPLYFLIFVLRFRTKRTLDILLFTVIVFLTYVLLFPALWVNPNLILYKLYSGVQGGVSEDVRSIFYNDIFSFLYYPVLFIVRSSPITLALLTLASIKLRKIAELKKFKFLIIYVLLYYFSLSFAVKKIDRYLISAIPPILLFIAIYVSQIRYNLQKTIIFLVFFFTGFVIYIYHPVYSAYYSPVFGSSNGASNFGVYTNSGQYYAQAAEYLNNNIEGKKIFVPYNDISFYYLFKSKSSMKYTTTKNADYIVTSFNKLSKDVIPKRCNFIEKSFGSRIENIVTIYKCEKVVKSS